jgi:hypothetical protein
MQKLHIAFQNYSVEIEGSDAREIWPAAAFWGSLPDHCPVCKSSLTFEFTTPKTFKYYKLKCTGEVPHCVNLGQRQDGGSLYFDRSKSWERFRPGSDDDSDHAAQDGGPLRENERDQKEKVLSVEQHDLISEIKALHAAGKSEGLAVDRVDLSTLADKSVSQLTGVRNFLRDLISRKALKTAR